MIIQFDDYDVKDIHPVALLLKIRTKIYALACAFLMPF